MLTVRPYKDSDLDGCIGLIRQHHYAKFSEQQFNWLHFSNPMAPSQITVTEDSGKIIGIYSAIKKRVIVDSIPFIGARDIDPVVHSEYRGKGVFDAMLKFSLESESDIDFHFNFANIASRKGFIRQGWQAIGAIGDQVFQTSTERIFSKQTILYVLSRLKKLPSSCSARPINEEIEQLLNFTKPDPFKAIYVERTWDYLQWRYIRNPMHRYNIISNGRMDSSISIAVVRHHIDSNFLLITDVLVGSDNADSDLSFIANFAKNNAIKSIRTWATGDTRLRRQMLVPKISPASIQFLVREKPGKVVPPQIFDLNSWLLSPGDLEIQ